MGKFIKLIVVLVIIAVAGYVFVEYSGNSANRAQTPSDVPDQRPGVEEKYGFTTETVGS